MIKGILAKQNYMCEREREMALTNQMSLRPSLLWLILNLALIIQCLSRIFFSHFYIPSKMSSLTPGGMRTPC
jgi:hypothetical protein